MPKLDIIDILAVSTTVKTSNSERQLTSPGRLFTYSINDDSDCDSERPTVRTYANLGTLRYLCPKIRLQ